MCHHYVGQKANKEFYEAAFSVRSNPRQLDLLGGSYYPLSHVPVVRLDDQGDREIVACSWGLLPAWWKPKTETEKPQAFQRKCFNARSEEVHSKPTYRSAFKSRRCLLPASMFEEKKHYFRFPDDRSFAFAGLWESWDGGAIESCTLLTTEPNADVRAVHHPRMPVILQSEAEYARWLDPEIVERGPLEELMRTLADGALVSEPIGGGPSGLLF